MRRSCQSIYAYLVAGLAIAIVAIVLISCFAAQRQNTQSLETQQIVARHSTDESYARLQGQLVQMSFWQDAYDNIVRQWNQSWVDYQFGPYQDSMGTHLVAIYGPDGEMRFFHAGGPSSRIAKAVFAKAQGLSALLKAARSAPARQPPQMSQGIAMIDGDPYFASAAMITPERVTDLAGARRQPYTAVFLAPATIANYDALSEGFAAKGLHIAHDRALPAGFAALALRDAAGRPIAWLQWKPQKPGADFLQTVIPAMIVVFLLLALVQSLIVRRWQTLQCELFTAEARVLAAEEESRTKSVFLGNISHELRTPLNAIIGFSDVMRQRMFGPLGSPLYEEYAGHIKAGGVSLLKIVNDLIEIARIEARDTAVDRVCIDAAEGARLAMENLRETAAAKKVTLIFDAVEGNAWCEGSALSLCHAVERVLDNAIRHSKQGASVTVSALRYEHEVVVQVRDTGDGIPAERLAGLGKPFGHTESHLVTGNGGVGLGLSIAKGLMRLMGGSLSVESEEGLGTTVTLHLPAAEAPANVQKKAA